MNSMLRIQTKNAPKNVLFLCESNDLYSPIAEAYLNKKAKRNFKAYSAGFHTRSINPNMLHVLREDGIDLSSHDAKSMYSLDLSAIKFDYVISFCDPENPTQHPVLPNKHKMIKWNMRATANMGDILQQTRKTRDAIKAAVNDFIEEQLSAFEENNLQLV